MIIKEFVTRIKEKCRKSKSGYRGLNKHQLEIQCDKCATVHTRVKGHYNKMKQNEHFDADYCNKCWRLILAARPGVKERVIQGVRQAYSERGNEIKEKISASLKRTGANKGNRNAMKRPEVRAQVSKTRTKLMEDPVYRAKFKQGSINAWARGAYDNANTSGYAHWHVYTHTDGTEYKVQGSYELAFISYLDRNNLAFECHVGKIPYIADDGLQHHYFPDFYVHKWGCYVDPKATYWLKQQRRKFELLAEQHPDTEIRILTEDKLRQLGIKL